jgi:hypothetical protein
VVEVYGEDLRAMADDDEVVKKDEVDDHLER